MRRCSAKPYGGKEPYVFVSYCHKDRDAVFPVIERLARDGYRIWYDEGIDPGSEWPEIIAQHLSGCTVCIAFLSAQSLNSPNCRREINFALMKKKPLITVVLEPVQLSLGMEMQLSLAQAILKYTLPSEEAFLEKLCGTGVLEPCLGAPDPDVRVLWPTDDADAAENGRTRNLFSDQWFVRGADMPPAPERDREEEARQKAEEEARQKAVEEARQRAEEEARRKAEEAARRKAEEEARRKAEEEARRKAEEEARRKAEEEARRKAEEEARRKAEEEARRKAEEAARRKAEEEVQRRAEEEARRKAEEERRKAEEEARKRVSHLLRREKTGEWIPISKARFVIGRSDRSADYVVRGNQSVSRTHAVLTLEDGVCRITDCHSLNHTYLNGRVLTPDQPYELHPGDAVRIYNEGFVYFEKTEDA